MLPKATRGIHFTCWKENSIWARKTVRMASFSDSRSYIISYSKQSGKIKVVTNEEKIRMDD